MLESIKPFFNGEIIAFDAHSLFFIKRLFTQAYRKEDSIFLLFNIDSRKDFKTQMIIKDIVEGWQVNGNLYFTLAFFLNLAGPEVSET